MQTITRSELDCIWRRMMGEAPMPRQASLSAVAGLLQRSNPARFEFELGRLREPTKFLDHDEVER